MNIVGNCDNEVITSLLRELFRDFCSTMGVSHAHFLCNGKLSMYSIGEIRYGETYSTIEEVVDYVNLNKDAIESRWLKLKEYLDECDYEGNEGSWFLSDSVTACFIGNNSVFSSNTIDNEVLCEFNCHPLILKLIDMRVEGYYCYDFDNDILFEETAYSNLVGSSVAEYCKINL